MGAEARCRATIDRETCTVKALLEADTLLVRAEGARLALPFKEIENVVARDGTLIVQTRSHRVSLALGPAAEKWAAKILNPPSRLSKIGVKPTWRASVVGPLEPSFVRELEPAVESLKIGRPAAGSDVIFFAVARAADLTARCG